MTLDASGNFVVGRTAILGGARAESSKNASANYSTTFTTGTSSAQLALTDFSDTATYATPAATLVFGAGDSGTAWSTISGIRESSQNSAIAFGTASGSSNTTEKMRIDSSGNLLVATTNASPTAVGFRIVNSATVPQVSVAVSATSNNYTLYNTTAAAYRFFVSDAGQINATSTSITGISDISLKENIRDLETGLLEVMALKPRRFDWKKETQIAEKNVAGFIAQEVETILPELVYDYQYNADETKKALKMGDILPTLVKAMQEQQKLIETLTARVAQLEAK
jgi:hypothetical protein